MSEVTPKMVLEEAREILTPAWTVGAFAKVDDEDHTRAVFNEFDVYDDGDDDAGMPLLNGLYRKIRGKLSYKSRFKNAEIRVCTVGGFYVGRMLLNGTLPDESPYSATGYGIINDDEPTAQALTFFAEALHKLTAGMWGVDPSNPLVASPGTVRDLVVAFNDAGNLSEQYRYETIMAALELAIERAA